MIDVGSVDAVYEYLVFNILAVWQLNHPVIWIRIVVLDLYFYTVSFAEYIRSVHYFYGVFVDFSRYYRNFSGMVIVEFPWF